MFTWPSDRNQWLCILGHRMLQFCTSGQTMVQTPESAIKAVVNPNDLHASRGQAMVQFAAKRWFKSHAAIGERSVSGGLHETERSGVKEAWGYPSGGGRAQVGRSGRQAKRCPNMRAEGTEDTTGRRSAIRIAKPSSRSLHSLRSDSRKSPRIQMDEAFHCRCRQIGLVAVLRWI
jgi:hypothetical protein